jgi:putative PIG3 family NAD(P)H quinone oxidoreductase
MKAVVVTGRGGAEAIDVREVRTPEPRGDEIRVRVVSAGINRADLMQARGHYPAPPGAPADALGLEYAGEVESLGPDCIGPLKPCDRVFGIVGGGGMAEYVVTHERMAVPIPANLDFDQAAAVPEVFLTAHDALETQGRVRPGERVLVHAVGGGVGSAATQLAKAMGCFVIGTSRTPAKLERAAEFGVDVGIATNTTDWPQTARDATGGPGVDVLIDHLGGPMWEANVEAMATLGRLVIVGLLAGPKAEVNLRSLMAKRLTVVGTTLRARPLEEKIAATRRFASSVVPWLGRGLIRPIVDRVYPLQDVREAQARMESNEGFGKIILRIA